MPISPGVSEGIIDNRLLEHFERSWARQEQARRILPARWLADTRPAAQQLNELFLDLIERARDRIAEERGALEERRLGVADLRD